MKNFRGLAHIAVYTKDMDKSCAFYEMLGGNVYAKDAVQKPYGTLKLAMIEMSCGFDIELLAPEKEEVAETVAGAIPHIAIEVENLPSVVAELKSLGVNSFMNEQITELPSLFGGLRNIFFTGPNNEEIELIEHYKL